MYICCYVVIRVNNLGIFFWGHKMKVDKTSLDINLFEKRDQEWEEAAKELYTIKEQRKYLQAVEIRLTSKLKSLSNDKNSRGNEFTFYAVTQKGLVDYSSIPELKNVDLEQYRKAERQAWYLKEITLAMKGKLCRYK